MSQLKLATNRLYGESGIGVKNIKLYPGASRDTTVEQFSGQINKAISQVEAGDFEDVVYED